MIDIYQLDQISDYFVQMIQVISAALFSNASKLFLSGAIFYLYFIYFTSERRQLKF